MATEEQKNTSLSSEISPLANDTTYGEKVYHAVFNVGINFVVNLLTSAGFSYWVSHSTKVIKVPWKNEKVRPAIVQRDLENGIAKHLLRVSEGENAPFRTKAAQSMAGVATLTAAGHFIMIPSVWLGAKIKAPMVQWLNERHYGKDAMDDPSLKARQNALEIEERPTLFGAIIGRAGTIVATQTTAWAIGHDHNVVTKAADKAGFQWGKKFKGLDAVTESIGDSLGGAIAQKFETHSAKVNVGKIKNGYGWALTQEAAFKEHAPSLKNQPYGTRQTVTIDGKKTNLGGGFYEHFGRYVSADILYTAVTSLTISPAINLLKHFIPGMTYTPKAATRLPEPQREQAEKLNVKPYTIRDELEAPMRAANDDDMLPPTTVSHIAHLNRVHATAELESGVAHG